MTRLKGSRIKRAPAARRVQGMVLISPMNSNKGWNLSLSVPLARWSAWITSSHGSQAVAWDGANSSSPARFKLSSVTSAATSTVSRVHHLSMLIKGRIQRLLESDYESQIGRRRLVHDAAALDDEQLSGHKIAVRARQKERRADDVGGGFDALEGALIHALLASLADFVRHCLFAHRRAGSHAVDVNSPLAKLTRHDPSERHNAALGGGVVGHVTRAAEESAGSDVDDLAASLFLHDRDHRFAAKEDAFKVDL